MVEGYRVGLCFGAYDGFKKRAEDTRFISSFAILPCHAGGRAYLRNRSQSWQCLMRGREGEQMRSNVLCRFCFFSADPTASAESLHLLWESAYRIRKSEWNTRGKFAQHFFAVIAPAQMYMYGLGFPRIHREVVTLGT